MVQARGSAGKLLKNHLATATGLPNKLAGLVDRRGVESLREDLACVLEQLVNPG